jgi:hypothetical protein
VTDLEPGQARMTHPDPDVHDAIVAAIQVPHFEQVGWRYVEGDREHWPEELQRFQGEQPVYIRHPETGGTSFVPADVVPHWRSRGWLVVDPDAEQTAELEDKKVTELKEMAKERGISPIPTTKAELIEALEGQGDTVDTNEAGDQPAQADEEE